jgi:multidrug resistance efflux pump
MRRRKVDSETVVSSEDIRRLRQAVKEAKARYHDAKQSHDEDGMASGSEEIYATMQELKAAEESTHG